MMQHVDCRDSVWHHPNLGTVAAKGTCFQRGEGELDAVMFRQTKLSMSKRMVCVMTLRSSPISANGVVTVEICRIRSGEGTV